MKYEEKRIHNATILAEYAREGYLRKAHLAGEKLMATDSIEEVKWIIDSLILEREALDEAENYLKYIKEEYARKEGDNNGQS